MELSKRKTKLAAIAAVDPLSLAFDKQLSFINDPARLKSLFCTRRASKTYTGGLYLINSALKNHACTCLYIGLSRASAEAILVKDVFMDIFTKLSFKEGVDYEFNRTKLLFRFNNGSIIYLLGLDANEKQKKKLLGQKYHLVILDEAAAFQIDLKETIYQTLKPATTDSLGTICMLSTPSNKVSGLFYDVSTGKEPGWSLHSWSALDNPHIKDNWIKEIEELKLNNPLVGDTTWFQQMMLGKWVVDLDALVYHMPPHSCIKDIPLNKPRYVLGIDLGFNDATAFVVGAYTHTSRVLHIVHSYSKSKMDVTDVANYVKQLQKTYEFDQMITDPASKQVIEELNNRHGLALSPANKTSKNEYIQILNDDFTQGYITISPTCIQLIKELQELIWDPNSIERKELASCANHCSDAMLYLHRHCYQYLSTIPVVKPKPGSPEYYQAEVDKMEQHALEQHAKKSNVDDSLPDFEGEFSQVWDSDY